MKRRDALKALLAAPAVAVAWTDAEAMQAVASAQAARAAAAPFVPKFFTAGELSLVRVLADIVIPKDDRSGSATDAGVPEFMDFMMIDQPARQVAMRGGLAWIDRESLTRFNKTFVAATAAERTQLLDDIAWPQKAKPELSHGVAFFNSFRDLTASGFFTSKMGMADLQYMGNRYAPEWAGCPDEVLKKLGI